MSATDSLFHAVRQMSNRELDLAAKNIRGTAKRGRRRGLTEGEATALAVIFEEQGRRSKC